MFVCKNFHKTIFHRKWKIPNERFDWLKVLLRAFVHFFPLFDSKFVMLIKKTMFIFKMHNNWITFYVNCEHTNRKKWAADKSKRLSDIHYRCSSAVPLCMCTNMFLLHILPNTTQIKWRSVVIKLSFVSSPITSAIHSSFIMSAFFVLLLLDLYVANREIENPIDRICGACEISNDWHIDDIWYSDCGERLLSMHLSFGALFKICRFSTELTVSINFHVNSYTMTQWNDWKNN